jgi:hypothetical protein
MPSPVDVHELVDWGLAARCRLRSVLLMPRRQLLLVLQLATQKQLTCQQAPHCLFEAAMLAGMLLMLMPRARLQPDCQVRHCLQLLLLPAN